MDHSAHASQWPAALDSPVPVRENSRQRAPTFRVQTLDLQLAGILRQLPGRGCFLPLVGPGGCNVQPRLRGVCAGGHVRLLVSEG